MFGGGTASSSDGQFFQAGGLGRDASQHNAHYGQKPGSRLTRIFRIAMDRTSPN
jgi:TnpA family transposase